MKDEVKQRLFKLPIGFHKESNMIVSLHEIEGKLELLQDLDTLTDDQKLRLVVERCNAGSWQDLIDCEEHINLERGLKEIQGRTELGTYLVQIHIRAIEMMMEDLQREELN